MTAGEKTAQPDKSRNLVNRATIAYYSANDPLMPDQVYDELFESVYGDTLSPYELYRSLYEGDNRDRSLGMSMLSLSKVRNDTDVLDGWLRKVSEFDPTATIHLAPKYDGMACLVEVVDGEVFSAATRGNGQVGKDVTYPVRRIPVPEGVLSEGLNQVEVCMSAEAYEEANRLRASLNKKPFTSPRSAVAGVLNSIESVGSYTHLLTMRPHFRDQDYGLDRTLPLDSRGEAGRETVVAYRDDLLLAMTEQADAQVIDGVVLYAVDAEGALLRGMGDDGVRPRWAVAWKFPDGEQVANLVDVHWQEGRTKNTPVATFHPPVMFGEVMVSRASMHNSNKIAKMDVQIGDQVLLVHSNEVIPDVVGLHRKGVERRPVPPEPEVQATPEMMLGLAVNVLDLRGLGGTRVTGLAELFVSGELPCGEEMDGVADEVVRGIGALIACGDDPDLLLPIDRVGATAAENIAESIRSKSASATAVQWFACLGLPGMGRRMWTKVFYALGGARQIIEKLEPVAVHGGDKRTGTADGGLDIAGLGPKRTALMIDNLEAIRTLTDWLAVRFPDVEGLDRQPDEVDAAAEDVEQKIAVVTGKIEGVTRSGIAETLEALGWTLGSSVSSETRVLFNASGRTSSKVTGAQKKDVEIVNVSATDGLAEIEGWVRAAERS